jgi:hypothetical protein
MLAAGRASADIARTFRVHRAAASRVAIDTRRNLPPGAHRYEKADSLIISTGCRAHCCATI